MRRMRWFGLAGAVVCTLAVFVDHAATWAVGDVSNWSGEPNYRIVGLDFHYIADYVVGSVLPPAVELHTRDTGALAMVAFLLATTVGTRARWARFVAGAVAVVAAALAGLMAVGLLDEIEEYWEPFEVERYQSFAAVVAALAVLILAAAVSLLCGARRLYDGFVVGLLVMFGAYHLFAIGVLASIGKTARLTTFAWLPGPGYLLAAGFVALTLLATVRAGRAKVAASAPVDVPAYG